MWFIGGSWSIESWSGKTEAWSWELGAGSWERAADKQDQLQRRASNKVDVECVGLGVE
jgi:hypothetical protein